jgi:hypothetical protein
VSAVSAMTCAIGVASAHGARGRASCKRQAIGSNPITGSQPTKGKQIPSILLGGTPNCPRSPSWAPRRASGRASPGAPSKRSPQTVLSSLAAARSRPWQGSAPSCCLAPEAAWAWPGLPPRRVQATHLSPDEGQYDSRDPRHPARSVRRGAVVGVTDRNPAESAKPPATIRQPIPATSPDDGAKVIAEAWVRSGTLGLYLSLVVVTGVRRGELCGLQICDVDLGRGPSARRLQLCGPRRPPCPQGHQDVPGISGWLSTQPPAY